MMFASSAIRAREGRTQWTSWLSARGARRSSATHNARPIWQGGLSTCGHNGFAQHALLEVGGKKGQNGKNDILIFWIKIILVTRFLLSSYRASLPFFSDYNYLYNNFGTFQRHTVFHAHISRAFSFDHTCGSNCCTYPLHNVIFMGVHIYLFSY